METRRWTNPSQPQTLQIAVWLLYAQAVIGLLLGSIFSELGDMLKVPALGPMLMLAALVSSGAAGFGIANDRKWGYQLGVSITALELVLHLWVFGPIGVLTSSALINFAFAVAQFALLLHPMSRSYQALWFK